ncbi:hypothetical protein J6V86_02875 [bacterium]|nr:hypothetical protein [bacterium]
MIKHLLSYQAIEELKTCKIGSKELKVWIISSGDSNTIYIQVDNVDGQRLFAIMAANAVIKRVLADNPKLKVILPFTLKMSPSKKLVSGFISFKKKPFWEYLFPRKK